MSLECEFVEVVKNGVRISDLFEGDMSYDVMILKAIRPERFKDKRIQVALQDEKEGIHTSDSKRGRICTFQIEEDRVGRSFPNMLWESDISSFIWLDEKDSSKKPQ